VLPCLLAHVNPSDVQSESLCKTLCGTPEYIAPEVYTVSRAHSCRACVLHEHRLQLAGMPTMCATELCAAAFRRC
jgi:serine/threonine protein kinase